MTASPTAPRPKITQVLPAVTLQVLIAAPQPVLTPHPKTQTFSTLANEFIFAHDISATTVYSLKVEHPIKWKIDLPSFEKRLVPSGIRPFP